MADTRRSPSFTPYHGSPLDIFNVKGEDVVQSPKGSSPMPPLLGFAKQSRGGTGFAQATDRPLLIAFGLSMVFHALFLVTQLMQIRGSMSALDVTRLHVIYEQHAAEETVERVQRQVATLSGSSGIPAGPPTVPAPIPSIRIPERPAVTLSNLSPKSEVNRTAVVDLTNLVDAAQGNPILLSYFSAIREQIQRTANQRTWFSGQAAEGVVYVSFLLNATGEVQEPTIMSERSIPSRALHDIAIQILKASSPFAPFPPSVSDASKAVVVPLEFLLGS